MYETGYPGKSYDVWLPPRIGASQNNYRIENQKFIDKWNRYLNDNTFKPVIMFRELWPEFKVTIEGVHIPISKQEADQIISTYFPIRLWAWFQYNQDLHIEFRHIDTILKFLNDHFKSFVTPTQINFEPLEMKDLITEIRAWAEDFYIEEDDGYFSLYNPSAIFKYAPKSLGLQKDRSKLYIDLNNLELLKSWLNDMFPSVMEPELKKFRLYQYLYNFLRISIHLDEQVEYDDEDNHMMFFWNPTKNKLIDSFLSKQPNPEYNKDAYSDDESEFRYEISNPDLLYEALWEQFYSIKIKSELDEELLSFPVELVSEIKKYIVE